MWAFWHFLPIFASENLCIFMQLAAENFENFSWRLWKSQEKENSLSALINDGSLHWFVFGFWSFNFIDFHCSIMYVDTMKCTLWCEVLCNTNIKVCMSWAYNSLNFYTLITPVWKPWDQEIAHTTLSFLCPALTLGQQWSLSYLLGLFFSLCTLQIQNNHPVCLLWIWHLTLIIIAFHLNLFFLLVYFTTMCLCSIYSWWEFGLFAYGYHKSCYFDHDFYGSFEETCICVYVFMLDT